MGDVMAVLKAAVEVGQKPPEWWLLIPAGEVSIVGDEQSLVMDRQAAESVLKNFADLGRDIVIDYEHQTLYGGQAPAAGWIKQMQWRDDGLWVRSSWTATAAKYIEQGEYRYFSPVMFHDNSDRRIVRLVNVALTNEPKTRNIAAIAAKLDLMTLGGIDMIKELRTILNLGDMADETAALAAVRSLVAKNSELATQVACKGVLEALSLAQDATEQMAMAKIAGLSATGTAAQDLSVQVASLKAELAELRTGDLVAKALKNGQTSPEELDRWGRTLAKDHPEQFSSIVLGRPLGSVIPVLPAGVSPAAPVGNMDLDPGIASLFGNSIEYVKKYCK